MDAISSADLVYFIIPNYCGHPCANYYVFHENSVGYFNQDGTIIQNIRVYQRFIIISNTESDAFKNAAQNHVTAEPEIIYMKTGKNRTRSTAGDMMESEEAQRDLEQFLKSLRF